MYKLVVLFSVLAAAAAKPSVVVPLAYSGLPAVSSVSQYSVHGSSVVPAVYGGNYGLTYPSVVSAGYPVAIAQPAHSPAVVLDAVHGVPLDTPEVVAARAAHYQAKALAGHHLAKRSLATVPYSSVIPSYPAVSPYSVVSPVSPLTYSAGHSVVAPLSPLTYSTGHSVVAPVSPLTYSAGHSVVAPVSPLAYTAPLAYSTPYAQVVPKALSVHPY